MESKTLYRKYRPKSFTDVVGQNHIVTILENALKVKALAHAYLFCGPHGVGKTSIARIFAHKVIGKEYSDEAQLDIIEIDAASNRRIDEIRALKERVGLAPIESQHKVYIIDEVHMLTKEAFNALLKTLEEPPAHVVFILATTEPDSLPTTIISRTQRHNFKKHTDLELLKTLEYIAKKEKIDISKSQLEIIAANSSGSMRDGLSILGKIQSASGSVEDILGIPTEEEVSSLMNAISLSKTESAYSILDRLLSEGYDIKTLIKLLVQAVISSNSATDGQIKFAKDLLIATSSADPVLAVKITFADSMYSSSATDKSELVEKNDPTITSQNKTPDTLKESVEEIPAQQNHNDAQPDTNPVGKATAQEADDKNFWPNFMNHLKKENRQMYTILRMTKSAKNGRLLQLACKFDLHYQKINNSEFKSNLLAVIEPFGVTEIEVVKDEAIVASTVQNDTETKIKDIMGGGEVVKLGSSV